MLLSDVICVCEKNTFSFKGDFRWDAADISGFAGSVGLVQEMWKGAKHKWLNWGWGRDVYPGLPHRKSHRKMAAMLALCT